MTGIGDCSDKEVGLPDKKDDISVTSIGKESFAFNTGITSITIPTSVTSIGDYAFCDCRGITTIYYKGTKAQWDAISKGNNWDYNIKGVTIKCLDGSMTYSSSASSSTGLTFELNADGTAYVVTGIGTCSDEFLLIPSEHEGKPVEGLNDNAFYDGDTYESTIPNVRGLSLPDSLTYIGGNVFGNATSLEKVLLPSSLNEIGDYAFMMTSSLKSVNFPSTLKGIGEMAFYNSGLEKVVLPEGLTAIGSSAFEYCTKLKSVTLPTTITDFGEEEEVTRGSSSTVDTFWNCKALEEIVLPEGITKLGSGMFGGCSSLTEVSIPSTLTTIPEYLFAQCKNLQEVTLHSTLSKIELLAFNNAPISEINFVNGTKEQWKTVLTTSIADTNVNSITNIFGLNVCYLVNCSDGYYVDVDTYYNMQQNEPSADSDGNITVYNGVNGSEWSKIVIPSVVSGNTMTSTCEATFAGYMSLTTVSIPNTIKKFGKAMFAGCSNLTRILYGGTVEEWNAIEKGDNWKYGLKDITVYCTDDKIEMSGDSSYVASEGLEYNFSDYVLGLDGLGTCTDKCIFVPSITRNNYITRVNDWAFKVNDDDTAPSFTCIVFPDTLTDIKYESFKGCTNLRAVYFPSSLKNIGQGAFEGCDIKELTLPENTLYVNKNAFASCTSLKKVTIKGANASLSLNAGCFSGCSIKEIDYAGTKSTWYTIANGGPFNESSKGFVITCSDGRIFDYVNFTTSAFSFDVGDDGTSAFAIVTGLDDESTEKTLIMPSEHDGQTVLKIGDNAFKDKHFDNIIIPSSIKYIGNNAFENISIPESEGGKFCFNGTLEEWNAIEKGTDWAKDSSFTVLCSDGDVTVG